MMRGWITGALLGSVAVIATAAPADATVTFGDAYGNGAVLYSYSTAQVSATVANGNVDYENDSPPALSVTTLPTSPLTVSSSTVAAQSQDGANALATASNISNASIFSAGANGSIAFSGGARASADGSDGFAAAASGYYFQYYFSSDTAATFSIAYALSGPVLGCCGNTIQLQDRSNGTIFPINHTLYGSDLTGTLSADLIAGDAYALTISMAEYLGTDAPYVRGVGEQAFGHNDQFGFSITSADDPSPAAVPEPASWAMMIGGFGLVGGALRRRRMPSTAVRFA